MLERAEFKAPEGQRYFYTVLRGGGKNIETKGIGNDCAAMMSRAGRARRFVRNFRFPQQKSYYFSTWGREDAWTLVNGWAMVGNGFCALWHSKGEPVPWEPTDEEVNAIEKDEAFYAWGCSMGVEDARFDEVLKIVNWRPANA